MTSSPGRRARAVVGRSLLVIVSLAAAAKLADLALAAIDPFGISHFSNNRAFDDACMGLLADHGGYREPVPGTAVTAGVDYRINALGLRGPETTREKPAGTRRVLLLGDSVCFGWGVPEERSLRALLEAELRAADPAQHWEVLNLAVVGHHTLMQQDRFERLGLPLSPDVVLYVFNQNDVEIFEREREPLSRELERRLRESLVLRVIGLDGGLDRFLRRALPSIRNLLVYRALFRLQPDDEQRLLELYASMEAGIRANVEAFTKLAATARDLGFGFAVLDVYDFEPLREGLAAAGVPYASISVAKDGAPSQLRNSCVDPHPNARAHALFADKALDALVRLHLLAPREGARK